MGDEVQHVRKSRRNMVVDSQRSPVQCRAGVDKVLMKSGHDEGDRFVW